MIVWLLVGFILATLAPRVAIVGGIALVILALLSQDAKAEVITNSERPAVAFLVVVFMDDKHISHWRISEESGPRACEIKARETRRLVPRADVRCMLARNLKDA